MKPKKYKVLLDIYKGVLNSQLIEFTTEDNQQSELEFEILEDKATPYDLTGCMVRMVIQGQQQDCTIVDAMAGNVKVILMQSMFSEAGFVTAELQIYDAINQTLRLTTPRFRYTVKKSLMDDNSTQADPNFSILQTMILEVSNANEVANAAKTTAESALSKANQAVTTIDGQVSKVNTAASSANTALDRATSVVTQEELANKIGHNGIFDDTNFNFTGSKVEQNGLVEDCMIKRGTDKKINSLPIYSLFISFIPEKTGWIVLGRDDKGIGTWGIAISSADRSIRIAKTISGNSFYTSKLVVDLNKPCVIGLSQDSDGKILLSLDGYVEEAINIEVIIPSYFDVRKVDGLGDVRELLYDRIISPFEMQNNLQVLDNSPSINRLSVVDKGGASKNFILNSRSSHVTMANGFNLEQFATSVMKRDAQTFTSTDGSHIEINNGIEYSKVLSGEIQGQTVKQILNKTSPVGVYGGYVNNTYTLTSVNANARVDFPDVQFTSNTSYYYSFMIKPSKSVPTEILFGLKSISTGLANANTLTRISGVFQTGASVDSYARIYFNKNSVLAVGDTVELYNFMCIETTKTKEEMDKIVDGYIPFGLSSTQAIINNNGQSYPIYEPIIQGKTRILKANKGTQNWVEITADEARDTAKFDYKLDSVGGDLGSTPSISDYVDRARKVKRAHSKEETYNGSEAWTNGGLSTNTYMAYVKPSSIPFQTADQFVMCDKLISSKNYSTDSEGVWSTSSGYIFVRLSKNKASSLTELKAWLQANPITVRYQLATPQEIPLTDEELKTYDAYKKLILLPFPEDKLTLNEDGSGTWINAYNEIIVNENDTFTGLVVETNTVRVTLNKTPDRAKGRTGLICDKFNVGVYTVDEKMISSYDTSNTILLRIPKTELKTFDMDGVLEYFKLNQTHIKYKVATPITSHIPKEIMPTILTHDKINILEVDSPVAPSSFKATLPINKNAEQDAEIQNLKDRLNTIMNVLYANPLLVNTYIDQEVQKSQKAINERMM